MCYECLDPAQQHLPLAMLVVDAGEDGNQIAPPMQAVRGGTLIDTVKGILTWLRPNPSKPWVGWKAECFDLTSGIFDWASMNGGPQRTVRLSVWTSSSALKDQRGIAYRYISIAGTSL